MSKLVCGFKVQGPVVHFFSPRVSLYSICSAIWSALDCPLQLRPLSAVLDRLRPQQSLPATWEPASIEECIKEFFRKPSFGSCESDLAATCFCVRFRF